GIGGYIGGRLAEAGHDVTLVARGDHLSAIQSRGLTIESPLGDAHLPDIKAVEHIDDVGTADFIFATVKLPDLDKLARQIPKLLTPRSRIITLQNGIDAKSIVAKYVNPMIVAQGVIYLASYIKEPGIIASPGGKHQMLVDPLFGDQTMAALFDVIDHTVALDVTPVENSDKTVWSKFTAQASIAGITALSHLNLGGVFASAEATGLLRALLSEAIAVANAKGIVMDDAHADTVIELYSAQPAAQSSSLLVDIQRGKPTELAWLSGRVHQLGQELDIPTPTHSTVWAALAPYKDGPPASRV
ncbi:2-dehydropantoate 2-reductase, partial [Pacificibacter sp.]|uniref:ketopantoate reductase family protein n=1 Tax=Pacificibacter sp. TaxID=1917866 RepID=UPI0032194679